MAHNQTYFGAHSKQPASQQFSNYQQRSSAQTTGAQYPSQAQPTSDSYSSYTAPTYASSGNYNYPSEYYGAAGHGTGSASTGAVRNSGLTELQQLAYASGLHNANQRSTTQTPVDTPHNPPSATQSYDHKRSYSNTSNTSLGAGFGTQQARPKSVDTLAGRIQQRSPALNSRNLKSSSGLTQPPAFTNPNPTPKPVAQPSSNFSTPQLPSATYAISHPQVHAAVPANTANYSSRQLPNLAQVTQTGPSAASYQWSSSQQNQTTTADQRGFETVDPTQVYDPWPEIQRKREALRAAKELEERTQAERRRAEQEAETRRQEEVRKEEARKAEEQRQIEERRQAEEKRQEEERRQAEEQSQQEEQRQTAAVQQKTAQSTNRKGKRANTKSKMSKAADNPAPSSATQEDTEAQIRELMAKMRVLNSKDPATLARIWEEERRSNVPQSQTASRSAPAQSPRPPNQPTHQAQPARQTATPAAQTNQPPPPAQHFQQPPPPHKLSGPAVSHAPKSPQTQMKPPPTGNTMWPADRKEQISKAASNWLNAIPENADKQVTPEEICTLLNRNPKYIELCQWLESTGLKLERASFARSLLNAVPDINQASTRAQQPTATQAHGAVKPPPTIDLTKEQNGHPNNANSNAHFQVGRPQAMAEQLQAQQPIYSPPEPTQHSGPYFAAAATPTSTQPALPRPPPQIPVARMPHTRHESGSRQGSGSRETSQKPATKAEAARKRDFSEIIDLTTLDDDEDDDEDVPPAKKQDAGPHGDMTPTWALPYSVVNPNQPTPKSHSVPVPAPGISALEDRTRNMDVVRPIEKKKALRRSAYDVRTIARDVLLATGKHPEMRPLNGHLDILKESFKNIDNNSDLSTIRWDLIDPGEPPADALEANVIEIDDDDADEEEEESPQQPKARPPLKVPSDSTPGRHSGAPRQLLSPPPAVPSNATPEHLLAVPKKRGPGRPRAGTPKSPKSPATAPSSFAFRDAADLSADARTTPLQRDRVLQLEPEAGNPRTTPRPTSILQSLTMAEGSQSAGSLSGYSAFRQHELNPDGTPVPKKKGRPVGWRKAIHSKEAQARAAGLTPAEIAALQRDSKSAAGAASRASNVASRRLAPYSVFKCQWEGCSSELHNMETLRKHVFKFHQAQNDFNKFPCFWKDCRENHQSLDPRTGKPNGFSVHEDFADHMEFAHLGPMAWELGDGQAGGLSESQDSSSEAYLYDPKTGRQVTPKIVPRKRDAIAGMVSSGPAVKPKGRPRKDKSSMTIEEKVVEAKRLFVQRREGQEDLGDRKEVSKLL